MRGDLAWSRDAVTVSTAITVIGPVDDNRTADVVRIDGMAPVDLTMRYHPGAGPLSGVDVIVSLQNIFNDKPTQIATRLYSDTPYDSTNYAPFGRLFSLSVLKKW